MAKVLNLFLVWSILFFIVFLSLFPPVESVYCYVCTSREQKSCGYSFMVDKEDTDHVQWCSTSCYKLTSLKSDREAVSRGCLPEMKTIDWCRHDTDGDVTGVMCTCNSDYCNGASRIRDVLIVLPILVLVISMV